MSGGAARWGGRRWTLSSGAQQGGDLAEWPGACRPEGALIRSLEPGREDRG